MDNSHVVIRRKLVTEKTKIFLREPARANQPWSSCKEGSNNGTHVIVPNIVAADSKAPTLAPRRSFAETARGQPTIHNCPKGSDGDEMRSKIIQGANPRENSLELFMCAHFAGEGFHA